MAHANLAHRITPRRCALCGMERKQIIAFALLAEACRDAGIKLKAPQSSWFDPRCARRAFRAVNQTPVNG